MNSGRAGTTAETGGVGVDCKHAQQAEDIRRANYTTDMCRGRISTLPLTPPPPTTTTTTLPQPPTSPSRLLLPPQEVGRPLVRNRTVTSGTTSTPFPSSMATPDSRSTPPVLTPVGGLTPQPYTTATPTLPRLTPQPSASRAAPPPQDKDEDMDSEIQKGPGSQQWSPPRGRGAIFSCCSPHTPNIYEANRVKGATPVANKRIWPWLDL